MSIEAKIVQVGNSKGLRIPEQILVKYGFGDLVILTEVENGILIEKKGDSKLSWADTYKAMSESEEDWSNWADMDLEDVE